MSDYCQAQQALTQLKLSFVLFSLSQATHPPTGESIRKRIKINLYKMKVVSVHELDPKLFLDPKQSRVKLFGGPVARNVWRPLK